MRRGIRLERGVPALDRFELLERLAAGVAVAHAAARRRTEDVLELRVGRSAVRAAEAALQLDELQRLRGSWRWWCEPGYPKLLTPFGSDPVGRPRIVENNLHVRLGAEFAHLGGHRVAHHLERRAAEERRRELDAHLVAVD